MRASGLPGDVNPHGDAESPGEGDVGITALVEQDVHRHHAIAEQNQDQGSEELREKLALERRLSHPLKDTADAPGDGC